MANIAHVSIAVPPPPVDTTFSPVHSSPTDSDSSCSTCSTRASSSSDDSVEPSSCYPYTPSPSSSSSSSATRPAAPSSSSSSAFTFSLPIRSSSPSPSNATSAYIRSFVCLVLVGVCSSSLYALSIRLSCDPFARLPPWPQPGLLFAGHFPYLRFAINLLWYCTPRTHAIAAFVMLWAFTLPGDDGPLGGTIRDYSRLSGWNGLLQELMGDAASTRRAVSAYFTLPEADTISSLRAPLMSAVEMENGVLASAPQRAASSLCSSSSSSSSSTCLFLVRRLLCCPFALLRLYFSPRTALGVLYRLALYNVLVAGLDDMGYELVRTACTQRRSLPLALLLLLLLPIHVLLLLLLLLLLLVDNMLCRVLWSDVHFWYHRLRPACRHVRQCAVRCGAEQGVGRRSAALEIRIQPSAVLPRSAPVHPAAAPRHILTTVPAPLNSQAGQWKRAAGASARKQQHKH